jgi:hypothetical protein
VIGPAIDEVLATLQFLKREKQRGHSLRHAFWHGGSDEDAQPATANG